MSHVLGGNLTKKGNNMTPEELRNKAKELYKDHTALEVASILGKSEPTIRRWVKGITKEPSDKYKEVVDELLGIYEQDGVIASHKEAYVLEKSGITITKSVKAGIRAQVTEKLGCKADVFTGKNEIVLHRTVEDKAYDIYRGMMYRCYDSSSPSYSLYGAKGVFVSEDWHDPEAFVRWYVENYVEDWEVDKDLFSDGVKHYSKETCVFLPAKLNACLGQMHRTYSPATKSGTNYVKHIVILGRRVCVKGISREEVNDKIKELKVKELVAVMTSERVGLRGEVLRKYDEVCLKICDKYSIPLDQLGQNLTIDQREEECDPLLVYYDALKYRADREGIPFNLTLEDLKIPDVCPVLGIPLKEWGENNIGGYKDDSPSIDKFIPELGYVKGNVSIISFKANLLKRNASLEDIKKLYEWMRHTAERMKNNSLLS